MATRERNRGHPWLLAVLGVALLAGLGLMLQRAQRLPEGPVEVAWDRTACAHCRMAVSERGFASQLQLTDGRVLDFDDPGCLMSALRTVPPAEVRALWFHHLREDRWLSQDEVAFVSVSPTPMGFGLGAVDRGAPEALPFERALLQLDAHAAPGAHR